MNITEKTEGVGRFFIHAQNSVTGIDPVTGEGDFSIIPQPKYNSLNVIGNADRNATISLYDIIGRKLLSRELNQTGINNVKMDGIMNGTYIVFIHSATQNVSKKISWIKE